MQRQVNIIKWFTRHEHLFLLSFKDSGTDTDLYQTYAITLSVWVLNIIIMIISLTFLLISDPIIYSDSEAYRDYIQMRKQAEDSLNKVIDVYIYI